MLAYFRLIPQMTAVEVTVTVTDYNDVLLLVKEVHMGGCQRITDDAVEALTYFCRRLNILIFHWCPNITGKSTCINLCSTTLLS